MTNTNLLKNHRSIVVILCILSITLFSLFTSQRTNAASAGDLVKLSSQPAVYYISGDGKRYSFPNEKVYKSWYTDYSNIRVISQSEMNTHPLSGNVTYRPGSRLIKIQSDPKTYAVTQNREIRWIENENVAQGLAGNLWADLIDDVPDVFFADYDIGLSITSAENGYNGMFFSHDSQRYLIENGQKRLITNEGFTQNLIQSGYFSGTGLGLDFENMPQAADIVQKEPALTDLSQRYIAPTLPPINEPEPETETVVVGMPVEASTMPASALLSSKSNLVHAASFRFTASFEAFTIKKVTLLNCVAFTGSNCTTPGDDDAVSSITIAYLNKNGQVENRTAFFSNGVAQFGNMNMYAPRDTGSILAVYLNTAEVSANGVDSGSKVRIALSAEGGNNFEAIGADSGSTLTNTLGFLSLCSLPGTNICAANTMTVRKSVPVITLSDKSPTGPSIPGFNETFRFEVTAGNDGFITMNQVLFKINSTDNAGSDWNQCGDGVVTSKLADPSKWTIYSLEDPSTPLDDDEDWTFRDATGADCGTDASNLVYAELDLDSILGANAAEEIGQGTTKIFGLKIDTTGASSSQDDTLRIDVPDQSAAEAIGLDALHWEDDIVETSDINGSMVKELPITGGTLVY